MPYFIAKNIKIHALANECDGPRPDTYSLKIKGGILKIKKWISVKEIHKQNKGPGSVTAGRSAGHRMSGVAQAFLAPLKRGVPHKYIDYALFTAKETRFFFSREQSVIKVPNVQSEVLYCGSLCNEPEC